MLEKPSSMVHKPVLHEQVSHMVRTKSAISAVIERQGRETDGRKERSRASRTKILLALMELIAAGDINPSAATGSWYGLLGCAPCARPFRAP
ncbi:MAG: hypothetical protein AAFR88_02065, partial [Pseudomonadota bacterium]